MRGTGRRGKRDRSGSATVPKVPVIRGPDGALLPTYDPVRPNFSS